MKITIILPADRLTEIRHDGHLVYLDIESFVDGHLATIRVDGDPLITHGYRLQAGHGPTKLSLKEID